MTNNKRERYPSKEYNKRKWDSVDTPNLSILGIKEKLESFTNNNKFYNSRRYQIDNGWNLILNEAKKLPDGVLRDGAIKEATAIIQNYEHEIKLSKPSDKELSKISKTLHETLNRTDDECGLYEAKIIISLFLMYDVEQTFSTDAMEILSKTLFYQCLSTLRFLKQSKDFRFMQSSKRGDRDSRINTIKKTIQIAKFHNNHALINECEAMIKQIKKEELITDEVILQSLFWQLHNILTGVSKGYIPLIKDFKGTAKSSATITSNFLIKIFTEKETRFLPYKNYTLKKFYENGFDNSRGFYHFKKGGDMS